MKTRKRHRREEDAGQDSFLDIVANLVGILVILVTVIGVRAQEAWVESAEADVQSVDETQVKEVGDLEVHTSRLTADVHEIERQAERIKTLVDRRQHERHQLQVLLTSAKRELSNRRSRLDEDSRKQIELSSEIDFLSDELAKTQDRLTSAQKEQVDSIELEHLPTPLAKTVFGREEHFQLKGGYLAHVPLNVLTEQLKNEIPGKIWKLKQASQFSETIGPVQGFHLRYTMHRRNFASFSKAGPMVRQVAELQQFILIPMSQQMGETIPDAIKPNSQFSQLVESFNPSRTVITVWTYPDSFGQFRDIKRWLFKRGFACAARPLPHGQPISGSPRGSRSAAQ